MDRVRPRHARREGALVALAMAVLYLLTLTSNHTEADDAISYAVGIREGDTDAAVLHAHHLLWGAIGWVGHNAALALGFDGGALEVLQVQNALTGAVGIGLLWWWLRSIGWPVLACVSACGVLGFSYAYWFYSSETEVYVLSAAMLVLCLAASYRAMREPTVRNFALLGLASGLAVLAHDTNGLFGLVAAVVLVASRGDAPRGELVRRGLAYAAVAVVLVVPAYTAAALVNDYDTPRKAYDWITGYTHSSEWGETRASQVPKGVAGVSRSLVGGHFVFSNDTLSDPLERLGGRNPREERFLMRDFPAWLGVLLLLPAALVAALLVAVGVAVARGRSRLGERDRAIALVCVAWAAIYGVFAVWWDPLNVEFWIVVWIPLAVLAGVPFATGETQPSWARIGVPALVAALFVVNLAGSIVPQASKDDDYWHARNSWYDREAEPGDVVIANNYHQTAYLGYFSDVPAIDAARVDAEVGGDPRALVEALRGWTDRVPPGDRVFMSREAFDPAGDPWSNCKAGEQCRIAAVLRPAFEPRARVVHRDTAETVWELGRGSGPP